WSNVERGQQHQFSADQIDAIAAAVGEDPYYIFTGKRPQPITSLAAQVNAMDLDHWAEDTILTVARQEERRVKEQRQDTVTVHVERLVAAGFPREQALRAAQALLPTEPASEEGHEENQESGERREASGN